MTFANATKEREYTDNNIFPYNGVLTGTELDSGDVDVSGFTTLNFKPSKALSADTIKMQAKVTEASDWQDVELEEGTTSITALDLYTVDVTGVVLVKFVRTGTADGDVDLNISLSEPLYA